ncbi:MAG TPA: glucose-6-phosphate dehydrogenase [Candidatus Limosilactobacillus merdigallinarum]|uniref:Glucose-6-phosphate 1-dehydrogenase n=1 Tax=Candidatus Limosilactobacillus merdigallinarum TaxID=2838652 RepID=A0A9D1VHF9_9LACO|nr:glucose-6-phosphate dehydrogenase [Candidatus Limosilactobacillus merdigallinarum]
MENKALITLFGAAGDLAQRKLYPSLFKLYQKDYLGEHFALLGTSRRAISDEDFQQMVAKSICGIKETEEGQAASFVKHFFFQSHDVTKPEHYVVLKDRLAKLEDQFKTAGNRLFYMSMAPQFFGTIALNLKKQNLLTDEGYNRLVIEKPFGRDFNSAKKLNDELSQTFQENQIFRIDHYLGKEMIQNIEALRFGNTIIESLWNNRYIDNVQVTLSEKLGVEERAGYYDNSGALRDMMQNHIMQVVAQLAMEQPVSFTDSDVRVEKIKALRSLRVYTPAEAAANFVRGQYDAGQDTNAYRDEDGVDPHSNTETFVAAKLLFDNYRWSGVPFYVRTGKKMADKFTRIDVVFKKPLIDIFANPRMQSDQSLKSNILTIYVEPEAGFSLRVNAKSAGQGFKTTPVDLKFMQDTSTKEEAPEPYERLLHDALEGNHTNFASWSEIAYAWKFVDVARKLWDIEEPQFPNYVPGSMGPAASDELLARDGRQWVYRLNR